MSGKAGHTGVSDRLLATELRNELIGSAIGLAALTLVTIAVHAVFRPFVAPLPLNLWAGAMAIVLIVWLAGLIGMLRRRPDDAELISVWLPRARRTMTACNLCTVASVWVLMPPAPATLQLLMVIVYLGYLFVQMAIATEGTQVAISAVVGLIGSIVAVTLIDGGPYAVVLSLFLLLIGSVMLSVRRLIRANVIAAVEARLASDEAAEKLRSALAVVAAERDARIRFIRAASHDLAQPLQAARLFFERHLKSADAAERAQTAAGVSRAFASTAALLDSMLMHLKLDAGAVQSVPERIDADDFVAQLAFDQGPAAAEAGMRLRTPRSRLAVQADPHLLRRALGNLVGNAVRHSKGENVLIAARRTGVDRLRFWVLDDGEGVDPAVAPYLFDDFAQGAGSAAQGGFGLGLASVRNLAEAMGGAAGHDPSWRSGSAFWIELPCARPATPALSVAA